MGICAHAIPVTAQDKAANREVLRALQKLRHEVSILKEQNNHLKGEFNKLKKQANQPTVDVSTAVPLKEISEQRQLINQQASRIDGLEARNASLQDSVDAVINRPPAEAIEIFECVEPAWIIEAGLINWRARRPSMPYAGALNVQPGGSFTNNLRETEFDRDSGFRVAIGRRNEENWDVMFRYTLLETGGNSSVGDAANNNDAVFANQLDRSLADRRLNLNVDDGRVDVASESLSLDHYVYDLELGKTIQGDTMKFRPFGGLRFAEIKQDASILYQNRVAANNLDSYLINSNVDMSGFGLRTGGQFDVKLWRNLSLFGRGAGSLMLTEFRVNRTDAATDQSAGITESRAHSHKYNSIVPLTEMEVGLL